MKGTADPIHIPPPEIFLLCGKLDQAGHDVCVCNSLQCGRQMAQQKNEYEEMKKSLEEEASKLRQVSDDDDCGGGMPLELVSLVYKGEACRNLLWLSPPPGGVSQ